MWLILHRSKLLKMWAFCVALWTITEGLAETSPREYAVYLTATAEKSPPSIRLSWTPSTDALGYVISRRAPEQEKWEQLASLPAARSSYVDVNVRKGVRYEYRVFRTNENYSSHGYISAGIELPLVEYHGKLVLLVDSTLAPGLRWRISRLEQDLVGDGWMVFRHDVHRTNTPAQVKAIIKSYWDSDPKWVRAVYLLGQIPVPYSGDYSADDHEDHFGAWPADTYYGDMDGVWTDRTVNNKSSPFPNNNNVPGDGKFDQSSLPSDLELEVARVDFSNLPSFEPLTELDLLRNYLDKAHAWRHGRIRVEQRGLLADFFGESEGEAFASSGWRNFGPLLGNNKVDVAPFDKFFEMGTNNSYLWAYGCGGGAFDFANGIGGPGHFNEHDLKAVFTMFFGSYFGDYAANNTFLKAALGGKSYTLTAAWAGRPHWFFHHMALGETVGFSGRLTANNSDTYELFENRQARAVHTTLLGDPTLRMHVVAPPGHLQAHYLQETNIVLNWEPSPEPGIAGYHIYRSEYWYGPFDRLTDTPLKTNTFITAGGSNLTFMVRAVKLETTPSGSYVNGSQGIFAGVVDPDLIYTNDLFNLSATMLSRTEIEFEWESGSDGLYEYRLERRPLNSTTFESRAVIFRGVHSRQSYVETDLQPGQRFIYRVVGIGNGTFNTSDDVLVVAPRPTGFQLVVRGEPGMKGVIESSTDLVQWKPAFKAKLLSNELKIPVQPGGNGAMEYFRVQPPPQDDEQDWLKGPGKKMELLMVRE